MTTLTPLRRFTFPILAECISPDNFTGKTCKEAGRLNVWEGNKEKKLSDLFKIAESEPETATITIQGDVSKVRRIGANMKTGAILINGNTGSHLGEEMRGGRIIVCGNVGGWAGSMMRNGVIEIHGDAGDYLGAPYRGSTQAMRGGEIVVHGNVGNEAGCHMKGGVIKVHGSAGQFIGFHMSDGTVYVEKDCQSRIGACMTSGKIIVGGVLESVLPTFTIDCIRPKVKVGDEEAVEGPFYVFLGDIVEEGDGKLYVRKEKNPHLSHFEKLL